LLLYSRVFLLSKLSIVVQFPIQFKMPRTTDAKDKCPHKCRCATLSEIEEKASRKEAGDARSLKCK
jgi:hypothetical protein